ncbi:hypothetical protein GCM10025864_17840 [Luteimicrobium album]|uniref:Ribonuclease VapC n=1 Tax=Luteimicrobium album TaxID=1054550 RepID=A0ABQ6HZW9_9MICO|nr:PIN domain-containing protein [Luteimicrobium album]GMA24025.1 hypothetical protein GCM10025864_17840 [Luteimicrobium album]
MARRLILDTNTLIAFERGSFDPTELDDDDLAIAAITVAEYRVGIELALTAAQSAARSRVLAVVLDVITVLDYTERTAVEHARLLAHTRRLGIPRGAHDLIIAAHALEHGRQVLSVDAKARFHDLPGVDAVAPQA